MAGLVLDTIKFHCISAAFPNVILLYLIWGFFSKACGSCALIILGCFEIDSWRFRISWYESCFKDWTLCYCFQL